MKDELFLRGEKVPMTKEAVRALALSKLELHRASHLIDIGAGTGSVSIEAALQYPGLRVTAIERTRLRSGCWMKTASILPAQISIFFPALLP